MNWQGNVPLGGTVDFTFTTVDAGGTPSTLGGTPAVAAYPGNSTTQITAGVTLTEDFDSVTGLNHVRVVASNGNGYAVDTDYSMVITQGEVNGVSVAGYTVGAFSVENRYDQVSSVSGAVTVGTNNDKTGYRLSATGVDDILDEAISEPGGMFSWPGSLRTIVGILGAFSRNKVTQDSTTQTLRNDDDDADIASATVSEAGGTVTRGEFS